MSEHSKRTAVDAELDEEPSRKLARVDDEYDRLDSTVQDKLQSMIDDGVVQDGELDSRALAQLASFPRDVALDILNDFVSSDMSIVRNKNAYLAGIMGRFHKYGGNTRLHPDVQHRLDRLFKKGLQPGSLDSRCMDALQTMPVAMACSAVDRFTARDLSDVRNISAFFMSNLRAAEKEDQYSERGSGNALRSTDNPYQAITAPGTSILPQPVVLPGAPPGMVLVPASLLAGGLAGARLTTPMNVRVQSASDAGKKNYALEQMSMGVRTDEFHGLSMCAQYVHPAPSLKLQQLWDDGNPLVSLLDDKAWAALADLGAPEALTVIEEVAKQVAAGTPRNVSAVFMSVARKYLHKDDHHDHGNRSHSSSKHFSTTLPPPPSQYTSSSSPRDHHSHDSRRDRERGPGSLSELPTVVQQKCEDVLQHHSRFLSRDHFDEGVVDYLKRLDERAALKVLDELSVNDLRPVRNLPAYIMGICRRHQTSRYRRG